MSIPEPLPTRIDLPFAAIGPSNLSRRRPPASHCKFLKQTAVALLGLVVAGTISCAPRTSSVSSSGIPQQPPADSNSVSIEALVTKAASTFKASTPLGGLSIGIVKDGVVHTWNTGELEAGSHRIPTASTLYAIGSVTKTFTATLLAQAVIENRLKLEDDVRKHVDGEYSNLEFDGHPIRLVHLLNHNSGLPYSLPVEHSAAKNGATSDLDRQAFFTALRNVKIETAPGGKFQYSNVGAQLLAYLLERVYGKSYEELVQLKVTGPLQMNHTTLSLSPAESALLKGYNESGSLVSIKPDPMPAAGALKSTVADMLKYVQWHMEERDAAARLTHQPQWTIQNNFSVALNWQMFQFAGYRYIWQEGGVPGFCSYCLLCPELRLGVVALANHLDRASAGRMSEMVKQIVRECDPRAANLP